MKQLKKEIQDKSGLERVKICAQVAIDNKAEDLLILDVRGIASFADYFLIMSGRSTRHVQGLAEALEAAMRSKRISAAKAEGINEGMWVLLDFDDVVVHIFYHEQRSFYDLEGLWHNAPRIETDDL
ncbi:MAG: ribosome silencing factor [Proteobacteria bacterium]|nr:ribosome silencing factor [Pseudomonadota bacterium]MBU1233242.1 ribosome silencing factor [Pseudomonadota bacterium]MBU1417503.1 ribosome silencing factor [Pseudomonadota bacterium]MBU1456192.1 ribosome silencing factor [Pseudomonadota bacterium]